MAQDASHFLNELPIWKLKKVAEQFNIDVSSCRYKRDYVEKIRAKKLQESQVRAALADAGAGKAKPPDDAEMKAIGAELEQLASKPPEPSELPVEEEKTVGRNIDEALTMKPSFFETDSANEQALNRMILGDFAEAIKINRDARLRFLSSFSSLQVYSAAVSIRAAEELLAKLPSVGAKLDPGLRTALAAAKKAFIDGSPRQREETLENLETLALKAYTAFIFNTEEEEAGFRELLRDYESFGTRTEESRRYLEIAAGAKKAFDYAQYSEMLEKAKTNAADSRQARAREIEDSFALVRASAAEARDVGVDTASAESRIEEARKAFEDGALKRATELLASVERATDEAHLRQMKMRKELEARQLERARATASLGDTFIRDATSVGMDVRSASAALEGVRRAVAARDALLAAKMTRLLIDFIQVNQLEVDKKRVQMGLVEHVDGVACEKCGHESLYAHTGGVQRCLDCGHAQSAPVVPRATPAQSVASEPEASPAAASRGALDEARKPEKKRWRILKK